MTSSLGFRVRWLVIYICTLCGRFPPLLQVENQKGFDAQKKKKSLNNLFYGNKIREKSVEGIDRHPSPKPPEHAVEFMFMHIDEEGKRGRVSRRLTIKFSIRIRRNNNPLPELQSCNSCNAEIFAHFECYQLIDRLIVFTQQACVIHSYHEHIRRTLGFWGNVTFFSGFFFDIAPRIIIKVTLPPQYMTTRRTSISFTPFNQPQLHYITGHSADAFIQSHRHGIFNPWLFLTFCPESNSGSDVCTSVRCC